MGLDGRMIEVEVSGPLGDRIKAKYAFIEESNTAIMEMAEAAGLNLIEASRRNPLYTSTYGLGEMIKDAMDKGTRNFIIGIGGSATNDVGTGMLRSLGYRFIDKDGKEVKEACIGLKDICDIDESTVDSRLKLCKFSIACDVKNVLYGDFGCSKIYGRQKGADDKMIEEMDMYVRHFADISKSKYVDAKPDYEGCGAAGGLGFAFLTYLGGTLKSGVELVFDFIGFEKALEGVDLVITGEGQLDEQSVMGKAAVEAARLAKKYDKTVIAFSGSVTKEARACNTAGIDAYFPILRRISSLEEAMEEAAAYSNLSDTAEQVYRLIAKYYTFV